MRILCLALALAAVLLTAPGAAPAQSDKTITLPATEATLKGPSVRMNRKTNVVAWWKGPDDRATWRFKVDKPATMDLLLVYGVPNNLAQQPFVVELDGKPVVQGKLPGTGGFAKFRRQAIGKIKLTAGEHHLTFRPAAAVRGDDLIDLQTVILAPHDPKRPKSAAALESLDAANVGAAFTVPKGFTVHRVAGPPLVNRPLFGSFDDDGRLYVVDSGGVNTQDRNKKPPDTIRILEDTDGDGVFDKSKVFADKIVFGAGLLWHDGAVYTASTPSFWKLEDTDGDDVCDKRTVLVTGFAYKGSCSDDFHGACVGPGGRVYFLPGRFQHRVQLPDGKLLKDAIGPWVMRCKTDGSEVEFVSGAVGNPVEVDFLPGGDFFTQGTFWAKPTFGGGLRDAVIHCVDGGEYPVRDRDYKDRTRTGELLPVLVPQGATAPAGMMVYRSGRFGDDFKHNIFGTYFNTHKVERHKLTRAGATFTAESEDFAVGTHADVHPTDVLEDADGSVLILDTGAWFRKCCPASKIAKPDVLGGIWRVRKKDVPAVADARGRKIDWKESDAAVMVALLDHPGFAVRQRAIRELANRPALAARTALEQAVSHNGKPLVRLGSVWALCRRNEDWARAATRAALKDTVTDVRQAAAYAAGLNRDTGAVSALAAVVTNDDAPQVRRQAATALGRIGDAKAVPVLLSALSSADDRFAEHAIVYALIQIADQKQTVTGLAHESVDVRRGALVALDQMQGGNLSAELVVPLLDTGAAELQEAALAVINRHPDWSAQIHQLVARWLGDDALDEDRRSMARGSLLAFRGDAKMQQLMGAALGRAGTPVENRLMILDVMGRPGLASVPKSWRDPIRAALTSRDKRVVRQAIAAAGAGETSFNDLLARLAHDASLPSELRVAAAAGLARGDVPLDDGAFKLLIAQAKPSIRPSTRLAAARALGVARLSEPQRGELLDLFIRAGPLELPSFISVFEKQGDEAQGRRLLKALRNSPGRWSLPGARVSKLFSHYPASVAEAAAPLLKELSADTADMAARLAAVESSLAGGDAKRGRHVFFGRRASCSACHRVAGAGGDVGPDLSRIGQIRTERDLAEAILFPSATFARTFETYIVETDDGKVTSGVISRETEQAIFLRTTDRAEIRLARDAIEHIEPSKTSIMPQGLDKSLTPQELADLIAFLKNAK